METDSAPGTIAHIARVRELIWQATANLIGRGIAHDASKLRPPEKEAFDRAGDLSALTYGTPEYEAARNSLGEALAHHYAQNSHHPEHHPEGIAGMSLFDLLEMALDWLAATQRMKDGGDIGRSIAVNRERFGLSEQLVRILENTYREMGALPSAPGLDDSTTHGRNCSR